MKTIFPKNYYTLIFCFLFFAFPAKKALAIEAVSTQLNYLHLSDSTYLVQYDYSYDMRMHAAPATVNLVYNSSGCHTGDTILLSLNNIIGPQNVYCDSADHIQTALYSGTLTLPAKCNEWVLSVTHLIRFGENILSNLPMYTESTFNNRSFATNSSPQFISSNNRTIEAGSPASIALNAQEIDGDSIAYYIKQPQAGRQTLIPFVGGFSVEQPFPIQDSIFIDKYGIINFTPDTAASNHKYTLQVLVEEYRQVNGTYQLIGATTQNFYIHVLPAQQIINQDLLVFINDTLLSMSTPILDVNTCELTSIAFKISPLDTLNPATLQFQLQQFPSNSISVQNFNNPTDSVIIHWTPNPALAGRIFYIFVEFELNDCPIPSRRNLTLGFRVKNENSAFIQADTTLLQPGQSSQLHITTSRSDTLANGQPIQYSYRWVPSPGLSSDTISNPIATPAKTTFYTAYVYSSAGCVDTASVLLQVLGTTALQQEILIDKGLRTDFLLNTGQPFLKFKENWANSSLTIYNSNGQKILFREHYTNTWSSVQTNPGIYFYILSNPEKGTKSGKILIQ